MIAKQKTLMMKFDVWEESYNHPPRWLQVVQQVVSGMIVQFIGYPSVVDGVETSSLTF